MQYQQKIYLQANKYYASLIYKSADQYDLDLFDKYSEPEINIGGTITSNQITFTLPDQSRRLKSDCPITEIFDPITGGYTLEEAANRAKIFVNTISSRIQDSVQQLRALDTNTNGELNKAIVI